MRSRFLMSLAAAGFAVSITHGCHDYPATVSGDPVMTVNHGTMLVPVKAPLSIGLDYRALVAKDDCYKVLQAVPHTVVEIGISGPGLAVPITDTLTVSCASGGTANFSIEHLPTGVPLTVSVTVKNGTQIVAHAQQSVTLNKGTREHLNLVCSTDTEGLDIEFSCSELCDPIDPSQTTSWIIGFTLDRFNNIYLFGLDGTYNPYTPGLPPNASRVVKVSPGQTPDVSVTYDEMGAPVDGEPHDDGFYMYGYLPNNVKSIFKLGGMAPLTLSNKFAVGASLTSRVSKNPNNNNVIYSRYIASGHGGTTRNIFVYEAASNGVKTEIFRWMGIADNHQPTSMVYAADRIVWTSPNGLHRTDSSTSGLTLYGGKANPKDCQGLVTTAPNSSTLLFSEIPAGAKSGTIYYWDYLGQATPTIAATFSNERPVRIERGSNGKIYVLLFNQSLVSTQADFSTGFSNRYRVVKYDLVQGQLKNPATIIKSYKGDPL